jgi:K(+)-stimulated pyrophosphate-energized sodium pump
VGDPFKDTSSVAMNPVIKFTTLFGLLAVELAVSLTNRNNGDTTLTHILALGFFLVSVFFVWRSFHGMRIGALAVEPVRVSVEQVGDKAKAADI